MANSRVTPEERERQRRAALVATGKMGDATLMEMRERSVIYAYVVRGVEYTASQDVFLLKDQVPSDLSQLAAMSVRYDPRNPANSIVVAEQWSGLHLSEPKRRRVSRSHWYRSASEGSIAAARRAGIYTANSATTVRIPATAANVSGSNAFTPNSRLASSRVVA